MHGPLDGDDGELYATVARVAPEVGLISLSLNQRKPQPDLPWVANCPNALDLDAYPVHTERGDYLLFLGRMSADKGCHRAIEVAQGDGPAAQDRREDARAGRAGVLRGRTLRRTSATGSSTSAR